MKKTAALSFLLNSNPFSTLNPALEVLNAPAGSKINVLVNSDSTCSTGSSVSTLTTTSANQGFSVLNNPVFSTTQTYRAQVTLPDGSKKCTNVVTPGFNTFSGVTQISTDGSTTCVLTSGSQVKCWGSNQYGQIGDGTHTAHRTPYTLPAVNTATSVTTAFGTTCITLLTGATQCWGSNRMGQLGDGTKIDRIAPITVAGLSASKVVTSGNTTCAIVMGTGAIKCWGDNSADEFGNGGGVSSNTPVSTTGIAGAIDIGFGMQYTCALLGTGSVKCWGFDGNGQMGHGANGDMQANPIAAMTGVTTAIQMAVTDEGTCVLLANGTVKCAGFGITGDGTSLERDSPILVPGLAGVTQLVGGGNNFCAIIAGGNVKCWGRGVSVDFEASTTASQQLSPVSIANLTGITKLSIDSAGAMCGVFAGGELHCSSLNAFGLSGDGSATGELSPITMPNISAATQIDAGSTNACVIEGSSVKCWGASNAGIVGTPSATNQIDPTTITGFSGIPLQVAVADSHACALITGGTVQCWGANNYGQIGNNDATHTDVTVPTTVTGITTAVQVAVSMIQSCAVLANGTIKCWGYGDNGRSGDGTDNSHDAPNPVSGIATAVQVSVADDHACATLANHTAYCWGQNFNGGIGNGGPVIVRTPGQVTGLTTVAQVSAGNGYSCALLTDQTVKCWGWNSRGQVGDGTTTDRAAAVTVTGLSNVTSIVASKGNRSTCALLSDGSIKCWGDNDYGEYGDGTINTQLVPAPAGSGNIASAISENGNFTCAIVSGQVKCWGDESGRQIRYIPYAGLSRVVSP